MAKTMFVNPSRSRRRKSRKTRRRARAIARRPARRMVRRAPARRRRRRNAGIAPFVQNPKLIINPRRRRRGMSRRRNPEFKLKAMAMNTLQMGGGAAVGAGLNILAIRRIENTWLRNGLRVVLAALSGAFFQNTFGGAAGGALLYPSVAELALATSFMGEPQATEADIEELSADIEDLLDDDDDSDDPDIFE